jgi:hypothetical protein
LDIGAIAEAVLENCRDREVSLEFAVLKAETEDARERTANFCMGEEEGFEGEG